MSIGSLRTPRKKPVSPLDILAAVAPTIIASLAMAALGIVYVTSRVAVVRAGYDVERLQKERQALLKEKARLQLELNLKTSPTSLQRMAREDGHFVSPGESVVVEVAAPKSAVGESP